MNGLPLLVLVIQECLSNRPHDVKDQRHIALAAAGAMMAERPLGAISTASSINQTFALLHVDQVATMFEDAKAQTSPRNHSARQLRTRTKLQEILLNRTTEIDPLQKIFLGFGISSVALIIIGCLLFRFSPQPAKPTVLDRIEAKEEEIDMAMDDEYESLMTRWGERKSRAATAISLAGDLPNDGDDDSRDAIESSDLPAAPLPTEEVGEATFLRTRPEALQAPRTEDQTLVEAAK
mmetsp:Transcript_63877/g.101246  ORF Transcript_63877/g.101246 Transcript_63877/m.101246 type:complete len:236 (+) Transcript_63877:97-804(+)